MSPVVSFSAWVWWYVIGQHVDVVVGTRSSLDSPRPITSTRTLLPG